MLHVEIRTCHELDIHRVPETSWVSGPLYGAVGTFVEDRCGVRGRWDWICAREACEEKSKGDSTVNRLKHGE